MRSSAGCLYAGSCQLYMGEVPEALADELDELAELASAMSADELALATLLAGIA